MNRTKRQTVILLGILLPLLLCLVSCTTIKEPFEATPIPVSRLSFAYVENFIGNSISMFTVSAAGTWTETSPAAIPFSSLAEGLVVDPAGRYVYVPNSHDNTVSMFTIDLQSGLLRPMSPATVATGVNPQYIAVDPKGRFVYTANTEDNTVSMFTLGGAGFLVPTNPASVHAGKLQGLGPGGVTVDPTGRFVYTSNYDGTLSMFSIDQASGVLSPIGPGHTSNYGFPFPMAIDPSGHYGYVPDEDLDRVYIFAIDQTSGLLTPTNQRQVFVDEGPASVGIDPKGRFLYVVNRIAQTIFEFNINPADGSLTPMGVPTIPDPGQPWQILIDPSGQLAYVSNEATDTVNIYSIGADGGLTPYSTAHTGHVPGGMGIAVKR